MQRDVGGEEGKLVVSEFSKQMAQDGGVLL